MGDDKAQMQAVEEEDMSLTSLHLDEARQKTTPAPGLPMPASSDSLDALLNAEAIDISDHLFSGDEGQLKLLRQSYPALFDYAVLTLISQSPDAMAEFSGDIDFDKLMVSPGSFGRVVNWFDGFKRQDAGIIQNERLPTFDIDLAHEQSVTFRQGQTAKSTKTFSLKVMGIGGAKKSTFSSETIEVSGPYSGPRQLQVPVHVEWISYVHESRGETLVTLEFVPTGTSGLHVVAPEDSAYKTISQRRDVRLKVINPAPFNFSWSIEKGYGSSFQCPVSLDFGGFTVSPMVAIRSEVASKFGLDLENSGGAGHLYADQKKAVLLRSGS